MRTPYRPRPALSFMEFFEKVLLVVIEIRRHVPRIVLPGRSLVGTEVVSVPPGTLREVDGAGEAASTVFTRLKNMLEFADTVSLGFERSVIAK